MKIYYLFAMILVIYYIVTVRIKIPEDMIPASPYHITAKMAYPVFQWYERIRKKWLEKGKGNRILQYEKNIEYTLKAMDPMKNPLIERRKRLLEKISMLFLVLSLGIMISCVIGYQSGQGNVLYEGNQLMRNEPMEEGKVESLTVTIEDGVEKEMEVIVSSRQYSEEELETLLEEIKPILVDTVLGENESLDEVSHNLHFPEEIEGYPFSIEYYVDSEWVYYDGSIEMTQIPEEGCVVPISVTLTCQDLEAEYEFQCFLKKPVLTSDEKLEQKIEDSLQKADKDTITQEIMQLPEVIDGIQINWKEEKKDNGPMLLLVTFFLSIGLFFAKDQELFTKKEGRKEEMLTDYPEIISKLTLLTGAGMTLRGAMKRIVVEYQSGLEKGKPERFAWNEMVICVREMESGISEIQAYDRFGKRCQIQEYIKLSSLISQNLKKGTSGFAMAMQTEAMIAMDNRRNQAKIQGEKIGTKIIMPMVLMLLLVMILIMVPAVGSI